MRHHLILALIVASSVAGLRADETTFALLPPHVVAALATQGDTPEAKSVIHTATEALERPPHARAVVHTEGTLPHTGIHDDSALAQNDWTVMLDLALSAQITGDARYLNAEERLMEAWLSTYKIGFDPIDETNMDEVILAYDLVGSHLSVPVQTRMSAFLRTMAEGYLAKIAREGKEDIANWQSHRIKLITLSAYALGDPKLIAEAHRVFLRQLSVNINRDSSVVDFAKRDALHYVVYDLEPLTVAALAAKEHGDDWFHPKSPGDRSVSGAIDWLIPFATGQKTHVEFVHSSVKFDAQRADAGVKGFAGNWKPETSAYLYDLAATLDPKYQTVAEQVRSNSGHPTAWIILASKSGL